MYSVSIVIPTLNSEKVLPLCLDSIADQNFNDELEVLIIDAFSKDKTVDIAKRYENKLDIKVFENPLKTAEAGKSVGIKKAKGEIIALVDSDNILPSANWLNEMVEPFKDKEILATEPIEYAYRREDEPMVRFWALLGMNDPLCLFLGNYDRYCAITKRWTEIPFELKQENEHYLKVLFDGKLPTIGANGFVFRKSLIDMHELKDYFFDIDFLYEISQRKPVIMAKTKNSIIHLYSGNLAGFARKQRRRILDFYFFREKYERSYPWQSVAKGKIFKFLIYNLTVLPLVVQMSRGYLNKRDFVWLYYPLVCWVTLWEYTRGRLVSLVSPKKFSRD